MTINEPDTFHPITRVLVVDDNEAAARLLGMIIELHGCEVLTAGDGRQAIQIAEAFRPDAILMDLGMPRMNGFQAARYLRDQAWGRSTLLVAISGSGDDDDKQQTAQAGFDAHLVKPVDPEEIAWLLSAKAS
ncbi:MAG: response regulator [Planctomycetaceae bacterium]